MKLCSKFMGCIRRPHPCIQTYLCTHQKYAFSAVLDDHHKNFSWIQSFPKTAYITDVGPRDGLQNESKDHIIPTEVKVELIQKLQTAGIKKIECGSFVSAKWVPQMANSGDVFDTLHESKSDIDQDVTYIGLVLNQTGMQRAVEKNVKEVLYVLSPSEEFTKRNMNSTVQQVYDKMADIVACAVDHNVSFRVVISTALGCPYEGDIAPTKVTELMRKMALDYSNKEIKDVIIADTIGVGTAGSTYRLLDHVLCANDFGFDLGVHFHDTYGQALSNILTSLSMNVNIIESSVGGLGGCPFAKGATGNVATEDVIYMLNGLGIQTNVDLEQLGIASNFITEYLNKKNVARVTMALNAKDDTSNCGNVPSLVSHCRKYKIQCDTTI
eukprot:986803_1